MEINFTIPGQLSGRDAIVEEQDTNLLAGLKPEIKDTQESYPSLVDKMQRQVSLLPGKVLIKHEIPIRLVAIIYDIEQKPVCREEWIVTALQTILAECNTLEIQTLVLPVLGEAHGDTTPERFRQILEMLTPDPVPVYPVKICLLTREKQRHPV